MADEAAAFSPSGKTAPKDPVMHVCDAKDCPARATRELWYDSGRSLHACSHHASEWCPWMPAEQRWSKEDIVIFA